MRQLESNPWDEIELRYPVGATIKGSVRNLTAYGAFVELEEGIDGLIHISQHSEYHVEKVKDIIKVDKVERRIGLSIKAVGYSEE